MMKRLHFFYILSILLFSHACEKVNKLSDQAELTGFSIHATKPSDIQLGDIMLEPNKIYVEVEPRSNLFPLTLYAEAKVSHSTDAVLEFHDSLYFETEKSSVNFYLIAESGKPHPYTATVIPMDSGAEILDFTLPDSEKELADITVNRWNRTVQINGNNFSFPFIIHPEYTLSRGATLKYEEDDTLTFKDVNENKHLVIQSSNADVSKNWMIMFSGYPQLPNAGFESWIKDGNITNIDFWPGKGMGWGTANNNYVQGTLPIDHDEGKAASMSTKIQQVPLLNHHLIAAGSLYTGQFILSFNFENPRSMTYFGIPHKSRIKAISFDAQYTAGPQLQQAVKDPNQGNKYRIKEIEGTGRGQAWVELLRWTGSGEPEYHGKPLAGLEVLGRGEFIFDGADKSHTEWKNILLPIIYMNTTDQPTHIAIVFSSSKDGDQFKGAPGSVLNIDNVKLIY